MSVGAATTATAATPDFTAISMSPMSAPTNVAGANDVVVPQPRVKRTDCKVVAMVLTLCIFGGGAVVGVTAVGISTLVSVVAPSWAASINATGIAGTIVTAAVGAKWLKDRDDLQENLEEANKALEIERQNIAAQQKIAEEQRKRADDLQTTATRLEGLPGEMTKTIEGLQESLRKSDDATKARATEMQQQFLKFNALQAKLEEAQKINESFNSSLDDLSKLLTTNNSAASQSNVDLAKVESQLASRVSAMAKTSKDAENSRNEAIQKFNVMFERVYTVVKQMNEKNTALEEQKKKLLEEVSIAKKTLDNEQSELQAQILKLEADKKEYSEIQQKDAEQTKELKAIIESSAFQEFVKSLQNNNQTAAANK